MRVANNDEFLCCIFNKKKKMWEGGIARIEEGGIILDILGYVGSREWGVLGSCGGGGDEEGVREMLREILVVDVVVFGKRYTM